MINVGGTLFFVGSDGSVNGSSELWKSDGTAAGTVLVKDVNPGFFGSNPQHLINVSGTLFFAAYSEPFGEELWKSDGTTAGTVMVKNIFFDSRGSRPEYLTNVNGTLFFAASSQGAHGGLWTSDGSAAERCSLMPLNPRWDQTDLAS